MLLKFILIFFVVLVICNTLSTNGLDQDWREHSKKYGEPCVNNDECVDFRMICSKPDAICQCDGFHDWTILDSYSSECVLNVERLRTFLSNKEEIKPSYEEKISEEAHNVFVYLGLSGIIALSFGVLLALCCLIFGLT